jgi:CubicO group peptidase (beta-lactamase class C family)/beta-glucosidase-like glycosyl hydrolase
MHWVDSVLRTLNTHEKAGQLFMIPVSAYDSPEKIESVYELIAKHKPGGLLITGGGPKGLASLINSLQRKSEVPLLTAIAGEWGLSQTLDSVMHFQQALVLSALRKDSLIVSVGREVAREMKLLGIHLNFGLNGDIHVGMQSYPTSLRYFGDSKERVADKTTLFLKGLHDGGVLAAAIHPAGGILQHTQKKDSSLQIVNTGLDSIGLYPFQKLVENGLDGMLTASMHTQTPGIESNTKSTQLFASEIIKNNLGFNKLSFTEIGFMESLAGDLNDGDIEKLALEVGNDMLINPKNIDAAIRKISRSARGNKQFSARLNEAVRKILEAKYDAGLAARKTVNTDNLLIRLNTAQAKLLKHQVSEGAITLLANEKNSVPLMHLEQKKFLSISIGKEDRNEFTQYLSKYAWFEHRSIRLPEEIKIISSKAKEADVIVIGVFPFASSMIQEVATFVQTLSEKKDVIVVHFGNPMELTYFEKCGTLLAGYSDADNIPKVAAQVIFGALPARGELPLTLTAFKAGDGIVSGTTNRLAYSLPEAVGIDSKTLAQIESITREAIEIGATPGSFVLVAKDRKVVYEKSDGWFTYENKIPVTEETIYDLASVTKVSATLQTVMFMHERGMIDINKKVSVYLPELKNSNKKDYTIKDILTHQAGLWPFLPFWAETVKKGELLPEYYSSASNSEYPYPVAEGLFAHKSMKDSLWSWIIKAKVINKIDRTPYEYRYSDMGFYILQHLAEKILNQPIEDFLEQNLYEPLGAYSMGYLPLNKFPGNRIAPTEDDKLFRKKLLVGYVHDQGAAMHGGIAGHAGLFGTANDLAKLGQMLLQKGSYGGYQYYKPETVELFTAKQYEPSRRGLGWDKPTPSDWNGPTTLFASNKTFGHTGFTGTCIWVDPVFNLVFIYLSNRVHPDMTNNKLLNANIRPRIQEVIYKAMFNYRQY